MRLVQDLWSILTPRQRRWVLGAQLLSIVVAASTITGIASIAPFFAVLGQPELIERAPVLHWLYLHSGTVDPREFELMLGVGFMTIVCAANLVTAAATFVMVRLAGWISSDLQVVLFGEYLSRPYSFHVQAHSARLLGNVVRDTTRAANDVLQNIFVAVTNAVTAAAIMVSVFLVDPLVAMAVVVALGGGYALIYVAMRNRLLRAGEVAAQCFTAQTQIVQESLTAIRDILLGSLQDFFRGQFERSNRALTRAAARSQIIAQIPRQVMECVAVIGLVLAALFARGRSGAIGPSLGELTFLGFAAYRLLPALQQAFAAIVRIRAEQPAFARITQDLRVARERQSMSSSMSSSSMSSSSSSSMSSSMSSSVSSPVLRPLDRNWRDRPLRQISLHDVSFRYTPDRPHALAGVSLELAARTAVGLVGANGAGKTTLADIVAGLLVPERGLLEVDGIPIDDSNRAQWQSCLAYVPQQVCLLDTTLAQNIALGVAPEHIDRDRLAAAGKMAQLDDLVSSLPLGYEHRVGEHGVTLSGGQRQRVGIARALYRNASVLILDEATNALDGLTEREIVDTIRGLRGRYTIVLIAHRPSTLRACDVIVRLEGGSVVGQATGSGSVAEGHDVEGDLRPPAGLVELCPELQHKLPRASGSER